MEKLNTSLPLAKGRLGGDVPVSRMYLSSDNVKRLKRAFGNKSIGAMGIIAYPEFAQSMVAHARKTPRQSG